MKNPDRANQPPLTIGACAALACIWEATAPKPGNVYRGADFADTSYAEFLASAAVIAPLLDQAPQRGPGATVLAGVQATRAAIGPCNTNLGILLLTAPLAAVAETSSLADGIQGVLDRLSMDDCRAVFEAIRLTQPGGLGDAEQADVNSPEPPAISLVEAMRLAADRDLVARQYTNRFATVFDAAEFIQTAAQARPLADAIVWAFLELLRREPDSLIARKCGVARAQDVSDAAAQVLSTATSGADVYRAAISDFDFWLRSDGNRLNPGTTADLIAAALFVLLREKRIHWPVRFYAEYN